MKMLMDFTLFCVCRTTTGAYNKKCALRASLI